MSDQDNAEVERCRWLEGGSQCNADAEVKVTVTNATETNPETVIFVCQSHLKKAKDVNDLTVLEVADAE